ncbi:hypothetical protein Tco_1187965, partial [Tanacetum coccineum]
MFASADSIKSFLLAVQVAFLLIMFLLVMFSFLLTEIESADYPNRHVVANLQSQHLRRSLKRQGADFEQPDSKKSKSTEPQKTSIPAALRPSSAGVTPDVHQSPFLDTPPATPLHLPKAASHPDVTPDTSKQPSVAPTPPSSFSATPTVT